MRPLFIASILIVLAAVSAPGVITTFLPQRQNAGTVSSLAADAAQEGAGETGGAGLRQVEIPVGSDGHFYVDAEVDFHPIHFMVDTGASVIALRRSDAEKAGIRVTSSDFQHSVQTANGATNAAETELDSVVVKDIEVNGVRALILPDDQLPISLLGGSFLNRLVRFQIAEGTLIFEN
jgi:aspartyl protease family protein